MRTEKHKPLHAIAVSVVRLGLALILACLLAGSPLAAVAEPLPPTSQGAQYLPQVMSSQTGSAGMTVDPKDRQASLAFFNTAYRDADGRSIAWTGNQQSCSEGTTSQSFRDGMFLRINYFRAMAGVPAITALSTDFSHKAQHAALMMSANGQLSHDPPPSWRCYSAEGDEAAGSSNLFLGAYSVGAIDGYMQDAGDGNYALGHRRWILHPQTQQMGTGDVPPASGYLPANALWVFDGNTSGQRPATRDGYVAWPPPGYVPYQVVYPRWSLAYPNADFSAATVSMTSGDKTIPVDVRPVVAGYGENTLVWEPALSFGRPPTADTVYSLAIRHVVIDGHARDFSYNVIIFDPGAASGEISAGALDTGLGAPPTLP